MSASTPTLTRGWIVTFAALGINLVLGAIYAWGVMAKALVVQWSWTKTQAGLPFTVSTICFAVMMIFAGRMQDRIGPKRVALLGGVLFGAGLFTSYWATTPAMMMLTFGLVGGMGLGLCYSATTPSAIKWFPPSRKGLITGIVVSGVGLAAVYVSPLAQYLLKVSSISQTFMFMGIGALVVIGLLSLVIGNPPAGYVVPAGSPSSSGRKPMTNRPDRDWHQMLATAAFYQLWLMFILSASAGLMILVHVSIIAKEQAKWEWGFIPVVLLAIFNTVGRIVSGGLSDRIGRTNTLILAFVLQAINMFLFRFYTTPELLVFGSAFTGLCYGAIYTLMPAATADYYGLKNLGVNYGLLFTAFGVAGVIGPIMGGRIRDLTGSYHWSFIIAGVMLLAGAALALFTQAPKLQPQPSTQQPQTT